MATERERFRTVARVVVSVALQCVTVLAVLWVTEWRHSSSIVWGDACWLASPAIPFAALGLAHAWTVLTVIAVGFVGGTVILSKPRGRGPKSWFRLSAASVAGAGIYLLFGHVTITHWPAPRPYITPYEAEPEAKATYLEWYERGFRDGLQRTQLGCVLGWSRLDRHGYYAGNAVGFDIWDRIVGSREDLSGPRIELLKGNPGPAGEYMDPNVRDVHGMTLLMAACDTGLDIPGTIDLMIRRGADLGATDRSGMTPLAFAAYRGKRNVVTTLLKHGALATATESCPSIALHKAASGGTPAVVSMLIANGCDVNAKTKSGRTPLMSAVFEGNLEAATVLIDRGADVDAQDEQGERVIEHAMFGEDPDSTVPLVAQRGASLAFLENVQAWRRSCIQECVAKRAKKIEEP